MSALRRATPLVLTVLGAGSIGSFWLRRVLLLGVSWQGLVVLLGGITYSIWIAVESRVSVAEIDREEGSADRGTMEIAAAAKLIFLSATLLAEPRLELPVSFVGLFFLVAGASIRLAAVRSLGPLYSHRIRVPTRVLATGPYAWLRHPAYLGTLVAHASLVLMMPSAAAALALGLAWLPAVILRTELEDRFLRQTPAYAEYAGKVRFRLIPGVY